MKKKKVLILCSNPYSFSFLDPGRYYKPIQVRSASAGRQLLAEHEFDLVIVCEPLQDESGIQTANEIAGLYNQFVLLQVSFDAMDHACYQTMDLPVFVLPVNAPNHQLSQSVLFLEKAMIRQQRLEKALAKEKQKLQDEKLITLCKLRLMETFSWSEQKAHSCIQKNAMDHSVTRVAAAKALIRKMEILNS